MFFKSKKLLGLDIGTNNIKIAEVDVSGKGYALQSFGIMPTPMGAMSEGVLSEPGLVGVALQELVGQIKSGCKGVCVGLGGSAVMIKKITMPKVEPKLLKEQIKFEAEQYIPFDISLISLAYHVLHSSANPETMDVLLIAAQNDIVFRYVEAIYGAKLNCSIVDVAGFALANCFEMNYGVIRGKTIGLLNIGASLTNFVVLHDGEVVFSRDVSIGGLNYTLEIHKSLGVTLGEAETLKLSASSGGDVPGEVQSILSSANDLVLAELQNSLDFFSAAFSNISISQFYYTGGGAGAIGLIDSLSTAWSTPFERLNPFQKMKINSKKITPEYLEQIAPYAAIAIGLGSRQVGDR